MGWSNSPPKLRQTQHQQISTERRLKWLVVSCALCSALAGMTASHAQLYKWVDENGKTQYSDTVPPSSNDRARKELRADGTLKRETERAATAEEKRLAALKAVEDAKVKAKQDERDRKDKALLNTYTSLADYDRVRDRALGTMKIELQALADREILLGKIIASDGKMPLPAGAAAPAAPAPAPNTPAAPGKPAVPPAPAKAASPKSAGTLLLEAKSELPRMKEAQVAKRRELEDMISLYATERLRLSALIDAEVAKNSTNQASAPSPTATVAATRKK